MRNMQKLVFWTDFYGDKTCRLPCFWREMLYTHCEKQCFGRISCIYVWVGQRHWTIENFKETLSQNHWIYIYIYICVCMSINIYVYIYIYVCVWRSKINLRCGRPPHAKRGELPFLQMHGLVVNFWVQNACRHLCLDLLWVLAVLVRLHNSLVK